ncbi:MAG TPA: hypothetical protein VGL22_14555 [Terracidiphilus sp.]|jgi:hypothetical protein
MIEFDNRRWEAELRQVSCLKQCRFPANSEIEIGGTLEQAKITMKEKGLNGNMQSDAAAFESWALALLLHCGVQTVQIGMDPRADRKGPHYERFLYRLKCFSELYPDWVIAEEPDPPSKALNSPNERLLNQPNKRAKPPEVDSNERMKAASGPTPSEADLELALEISSSFRSHFQLEKVMRQWPVGLFDGWVADGRQIFTGGKSGIDLIGIRNGTLVLFELKKSDNRKAGAISELLFYASVMRDAIGPSAIFEFESKEARKNCAIGPEDIIRCSNIHAVLLAPNFHPLISEPRIFQELNKAAMKRFGSDRQICFQTATISSYPQDGYGDFKFSTRQIKSA